MRHKRIVLSLIVVLVLVIVVMGPVVVRQLTPARSRRLEGVGLAETRYRDVRFTNESQGIELAGMLFRPEGDGPFAAAVIVHGSGTSRRENAWYLTLTACLQRHGIAVLLPDKRGSEQSRGNWRTASLDELATDTVAAIRYLRHQDHVPISRIGIVGMSQGGHIAPLVASKSSEVAFVVNVVGSATPLRNGLVYEENHNLRELGFLPGVSNVVARLSTTYLVRVGQKDFWNAIGDLDPIAHWQTLTVPALVLYGENDTNVNSSESAARLRSLEKPNIDVAVYAGSGHALEDPPEQGNSIFREDALDRITTFIHSATSDAR